MKTVIGIDYGTQSARALLVDAATGEVLCSHSIRYPHGVTEGELASAQDYEEALEALLQAVTPEQYRSTVAGICVDATSLTLVPLAADGRVLCQLPGYENHPQAQIKLWKRHAAQTQADEALKLAQKCNLPILRRTGGSISSEWTLPKLLEMRDEAPELYAHMDCALDLCDFLTFRLTGEISRSTGSLSFKSLWAQDLGFPADGWLKSLRPGFAVEYRRLMRGPAVPPASRAGWLSEAWRTKLGLPEKVAVASGVLDGHTGPAALGALEPGDAALIIGTSNVLAILTKELHEVKDICGIAKDAFAPGFYCIDSGQNCTGDMLEWYVTHALPACTGGENPHQWLASHVKNPWECHLTAADWWNGSRNAPCDLNLSGLIMGLCLDTRPEEIYLALLQSIACGTREIIDSCEKQGVKIRRLVASGGVALKNPLLMQEYANILNRTIQVGEITEGPAMGSAILAAVAGGVYPTVQEAYQHMGVRAFTAYEPDSIHRNQYEALYQRNHRLRQLAAAFHQEA